MSFATRPVWSIRHRSGSHRLRRIRRPRRAAWSRSAGLMQPQNTRTRENRVVWAGRRKRLRTPSLQPYSMLTLYRNLQQPTDRVLPRKPRKPLLGHHRSTMIFDQHTPVSTATKATTDRDGYIVYVPSTRNHRFAILQPACNPSARSQTRTQGRLDFIRLATLHLALHLSIIRLRIQHLPDPATRVNYGLATRQGCLPFDPAW